MAIARSPRRPTQFQSPHTAAVALATLLILIAVLGVLVADLRVSEIHELIKMQQDAAGVSDRLMVSRRSAQALDLPVVVAGLLSVPAWLIWQLRAHRNTVSLGAHRLRFASPAAVVGSWLVPGVNLILPVLAIREVWKASDPESTPLDWPHRRASLLLLAWWIAFVAFVALTAGVVVTWVGSSAATLVQITRDKFLIAAGLAAAPAAGLAASVVLLISGRQEQKQRGFVAERWAGWPGGGSRGGGLSDL